MSREGSIKPFLSFVGKKIGEMLDRKYGYAIIKAG